MKQAVSKKRKGFTLVELVVVIAVLAILAVLATMALGDIRLDARRAALKYDANALVSAANTYNGLAPEPVAVADDGTNADAISSKRVPTTGGVFTFVVEDLFATGRDFNQTVSMSAENASRLMNSMIVTSGETNTTNLLLYRSTTEAWIVNDVAFNTYTFPPLS